MAGLLHTLPLLSYHFGLTKSDVMDLSPGQLESYMDTLDEIARENRRG